ncbi:MAG: flagellar hook-length control protein FliK [Phycisphaerales bacterium]
MTTLQTQTTHQTLEHAFSISSAGSTPDRAASTAHGANTASEFSGILDAFSEDDYAAELVDQSSDETASESESGDEAQNTEVNAGSTEEGAVDPDASADEIEQLVPVPVVKVNSTGDIARQLSHAADIDLASLAGAQLSKNASLGSDPARVSASANQLQSQSGSQVSNSNHQSTQQSDSNTQQHTSRSQNLHTNHPDELRPATNGLPQHGLPQHGLPQSAQPQFVQVAAQDPINQNANAAPQHSHSNQFQHSASQISAQLGAQLGAQAVFVQRNTDQATHSKSEGVRAINEAASLSGIRTVAGSESSNLGAGQGNTDQRSLEFANNATNANKLAQQSSDENTVMRQRVMNQVQRGLASIMNTKGGTMKIRLSPEHLGEVNIALKASDGHVQVSIDARNEQTRTMLSDGLDDLRLILESKGVQVDELRMQSASENAFSRFLGDTQTGAGSEQDSTNRQGRERDSSSTQSDTQDQNLNEEETATNKSGSIWTDLGLDAIA